MRNELPTLVAGAPGEVSKVMKVILVLSSIPGGEGLCGCLV